MGPFRGKPACHSIDLTPGRGRGTCVDAFMLRMTIAVPDVEAYTGHIARDEQMKREIICPLILRSSGKEVCLGVLIWTAWRKPASIKTIGVAWRR